MTLIDRDKAIATTWRGTGYSDPVNVATAIRERLEQLPTVSPAPDLSAIRNWLGRWDETTEFSVGYLKGMLDTLEAQHGHH